MYTFKITTEQLITALQERIEKGQVHVIDGVSGGRRAIEVHWFRAMTERESHVVIQIEPPETTARKGAEEQKESE
jgi:hypothetical protein